MDEILFLKMMCFNELLVVCLGEGGKSDEIIIYYFMILFLFFAI